jgi:tetratricopeptide (TPR) repeat protein
MRLLVLLLAALPLLAQDVGDVSFANTGAPAAQPAFLRGLALLHNFEYADAADAFRQAQKLDPEFAMAWWGEAMTYTHPVWFQQDAAAARAVLKKAPPAKTERERDYLHTLDVLYGDGTKEERDFRYADAMRALHEKYPDDVDATAFYALSLLGTAHHGRDYATYMRAAALLEEVFPTHRRHPGVLHYLIHSYDDPIHAPLGLRAARIYGSVAPNAGHALHMTSHIFIAMGMWDDVIAANERAMAVVNEHRAAHHEPPQACGHYANWLEYAYLQKGHAADAKRVLDDCRAMAPSESYAEMRARWIVDGGKPEDAPPQANPPSADARFTNAYADALAARGNAPALHEAQTRLHAAETGAGGRSTMPGERERVGVIAMEVDALALLADGKRSEGLTLLRKAADAERAMPVDFGPPPVEKPAVELLADETHDAALYAEALKRYPGRRWLSSQVVKWSSSQAGRLDH